MLLTCKHKQIDTVLDEVPFAVTICTTSSYQVEASKPQYEAVLERKSGKVSEPELIVFRTGASRMITNHVQDMREARRSRQEDQESSSLAMVFIKTQSKYKVKHGGGSLRILGLLEL